MHLSTDSHDWALFFGSYSVFFSNPGIFISAKGRNLFQFYSKFCKKNTHISDSMLQSGTKRKIHKKFYT
jgi:hypothetical protein